MGRRRSIPVLLYLIVLSLMVCFCPLGCQRSMERSGLRKVVPDPQPSVVTFAETTRQNLSMASELKDIPLSDYVIGPDDRIEISVFRRDEMKMEATVSATGKVSIYLLGDIQVAGLTEFELRDKLERALAKFIKEPNVVVHVKEYRSKKVLVLGQVRNPGVYPVRSRMTLLEALTAAGGPMPSAYLGGAYVVRNGKVLLVNFYELVVRGNTDEDIPLLAGDTVYIPDDRDQRVFVLGEVGKQSAVPIMGKGLTLLEAIAMAGGFTRDAKKSAIMVMRGNLSAPGILQVDGEDLGPSVNIRLQRGDIIYVAQSGFAGVEEIALRLSHILDPFYKLARTVVWGDAAQDVVFSGANSRFVFEAD